MIILLIQTTVTGEVVTETVCFVSSNKQINRHEESASLHYKTLKRSYVQKVLLHRFSNPIWSEEGKIFLIILSNTNLVIITLDVERDDE